MSARPAEPRRGATRPARAAARRRSASSSAARTCSSSPTSSARRAGSEPLGQLAQRHEVIAVRLYDPLEMELPDLGLLTMQDAETGEQLFVDTHDSGFRKRFAARRRAARGRAARGASRAPASTRSSSPPTTTWSTRSCASPTCASAAAGSPPARRPGRLRMAAARLAGERAHDLPLAANCCGCCCALPLLVAALCLPAARARRAALRYASLAMVKRGDGRRAARGAATCRRALFLLALAAMLLAAARPAAVVTLPSQQETIILAMDVSGSMRADRRRARTAWSRRRTPPRPSSPSCRATCAIGIVAFAGTAAVVQPPTHSRDDLIAAIDRFQLQRGTAIGSGIVVSLATHLPRRRASTCSTDPRERQRRRCRRRAGRRSRSKDVQAGAAGLVHVRRDHPAHRRPAHDRARPDRGRASMAADRGVRVYTVGIGTDERRDRSASRAGRCGCASTRRR